MIACGGAHQLPAEHTHHVRGVYAVPALGLHGINRCAVRDLARLKPDVEKAGLDDRARDGVEARVGADADT